MQNIGRLKLAFSFLFLGSASAFGQVDYPPELSAAGPTGNLKQQTILKQLENFKKDFSSCGLVQSEDPNFPESSTYRNPSDLEMDSIFDLVDDLDSSFTVTPGTGSPYKLPYPVIGPDAFRRALELKIIKPVTGDTMMNAAVNGHFLLSTGCGKILFRLELPGGCWTTNSIEIAFSDLDKRTISFPFTNHWLTLGGTPKTDISTMMPGIVFRSGRGTDVMTRTKSDMVYVLRPVSSYPASYGERSIAQEIFLKKAAKSSWTLYQSGEMALLALEFVPSGSIWRTILSKGYNPLAPAWYQYETWDGASDAAQLTLDIGSEVIPVIARYRSARKASKVLYGVTASAVLGKAAWDFDSSALGGVKADDALRIIVVGMLATQLKSKTGKEIADDLAGGMLEAQNIFRANPAQKSIQIAKNSIEHLKTKYLSRMRSAPLVNSLERGITYVSGANWIDVKDRLRSLDNLREYIRFKMPRFDSDPSDLLGGSGIDDYLRTYGKKLEIGDTVEIGLSSIARLRDEFPSLEEFREQLNKLLMSSGGANQYSNSIKTVYLALRKINGNPANYNLSDDHMAIVKDVVDNHNQLLIQEEVMHALGHLDLPNVGYPTLRGNWYVPLTKECFNFESWISMVDQKQLKSMFPAEKWSTLSNKAASQGMTQKQYLVATIMEADIYFRAQSTDLVMGKSQIYDNYPVRYLAAEWHSKIATSLQYLD